MAQLSCGHGREKPAGHTRTRWSQIIQTERKEIMNPEECLHENIEKEVMMGVRTGDRICRDCGALFASSAELKEARDATRDKMKSPSSTELSLPDQN